MDGPTERVMEKQKEAALSVTLFQRFAFNQLKIEWVGGWMDG